VYEIEKNPDNTMTLNMGPHHPSTHGVLRFILEMEGEIIKSVKPDVGYLHRSIEKIGERVPYPAFMPYTDRVDYVAAANCNVGYALAVEKLAGIEVPERAQYIRVIVCELNRIISHLLMTGVLAMDVGAYTPFLHALREREKINDIFEIFCGARLTYNLATIGGMPFDIKDTTIRRCLEILDGLKKFIVEFNDLVTDNVIFVKRLANIGIIDKETAKAYMLVGPNLRASGSHWDLRKTEPYLVYDKFTFDVAIGDGSVGTRGDSFDRYIVRIREIETSISILEQAFRSLPAGEVQAKLPKTLKPPKGEVYVRTESARGELGYYIISDGTANASRIKIRTGSFAAISILDKIGRGLMLSDLVAFMASLDLIAPEIDR
jgi:NADH-quinone oxidoreductase subunit D